jgi:hypothetical protein
MAQARLLGAPNQFAEFQAQCERKRIADFQPYIDLSKFNRADICPVDISALGEFFL